MKKTLTFMLLMAAMVSCNDHAILVEDHVPCQINNESRSNQINIDLLENWEDAEIITLPNGKKVVPPWKPFTSITFDTDFAFDIKKEDGWVMLFHTMKENTQPYMEHNYMFFYNQLTGFLKVFYYEESTGTTAQKAMWQLESNSNTSLLNLNTYIALPDNAKEYGLVAISNASTLPTSGFSGGWNGFEIEVPFTRDYKDVLFKVSGYSRRILSYNFSGFTEQNIEGVIVKNVEQNEGLFKAISSIGGKGIKKLINKLQDSSNPKSKLGKSTMNLLSNFSAGNFSSAIQNGLGAIFGTSTVTDTTIVKLTSSGTINLEGSGSEIIPGTPLNLSNIPLYNIMNTPIAMSIDPQYKSLEIKKTSESQDEEQFLGVWTLTDSPIINFNRYSKINNAFITSNHIQYSYLDWPYFYPPIQMQVEFNPNIKPYITNHYITTKVIKADKISGEHIECLNFIGINSELIYSDEDMELYEAPFNNYESNSPLVSGSYAPDGYDYFYKWGEEAPNNLFVIVTVDVDYQYKGKKKNFVSSRIYKAKCIINTDLEQKTLMSGKKRKPYIVNTQEFPTI